VDRLCRSDVAGWRHQEHSFGLTFKFQPQILKRLFWLGRVHEDTPRFLSRNETHAGTIQPLIVDRHQITSVNFHLNNPDSG
jgi:hypothetical protein